MSNCVIRGFSERYDILAKLMMLMMMLPLTRSNKGWKVFFFLLFKRDSSKGILEKLTSAAAVFECHMLLFLQLCKLRDV